MKFLIIYINHIKPRFLAHYGRILPSDFIPGLKNSPPNVVMSNPSLDADLPKIDIYERPKENEKKSKLDKNTLDEVEKLSQEHRHEIQKLKEDLSKYKEEHEAKSYKKKFEDVIKEIDLEREKNRVLKSKLIEIENKQLPQSFRKDIKENGKLKDLDIEKLRVEFEQISKMTQIYSNLEDQENINPDIIKKPGKDGIIIQKLQGKINYLNSLLQMTSKATFDAFFKKLIDKQAKYDDSKILYENHLMKAEDDVQREKVKIMAYEEKVQNLNKEIFEYQKKISQYIDDSKKATIQVSDLKNQIIEKNTQYNTELQNIRTDIKIKIDLLRQKDEVIKTLSDIRNKLSKETGELKEQVKEGKDQLINFEKKIKLEHMDFLNNIYSVHNGEIEKIKNRIKVFENDIENKNIEIQRSTKNASQIEKELKSREDQVNKLNYTIDSLNKKIQKMNEDSQSYKNKIDNLEITIQNKFGEIVNLQKLNSLLTAEKINLQDDLSTHKQFNNEGNKKWQNINEIYKKAETEKNSIKLTIEKQASELEKKNAEIENLKKQIEQVDAEKKMLKEELSTLDEGHEAGRVKISNLTEELNNKIIDLSTLQSSYDLLTAELENSRIKNIKLNEDVCDSKNDNEKLLENKKKLSYQIEADKKIIQHQNQKIKDTELINEQLQIESQIKINLFNDLDKKIKEFNDQNVLQEESINRLNSENKKLKEDISIKEADANEKVRELLFQTEKLTQIISEKNNDIDSLNSKIYDLQSKVDKLKDHAQSRKLLIQEKDEKYSKLADEARDKELKLAQFVENLSKKSEKIEQLSLEINQKEELILQLSEKIKMKEETLSNQGEIKEKEDQIKKLTIEISNSILMIKTLENQEIAHQEKMNLVKKESSHYRELLENQRKTQEKTFLDFNDLKNELKSSQLSNSNSLQQYTLENKSKVNFLK